MPKRPPESRAGPAPIPLVARLELPATTNLFFLGREPPRHDEGAPNGNGNEAVHDGRPAPLVDIISSEEAKRRVHQGISEVCSLPMNSTSLPLSSVMVADKWAFVSVFDGDSVLRVVNGDGGEAAAALWVEYLAGGMMRRVMIPFETVGALRIGTTTSPLALDPFVVQCKHCQRRFVSQPELHIHQGPCGGYHSRGEGTKASPSIRNGMPAAVLALTRAPLFYREVAASLDEVGQLQWLGGREESDPSGGHITQLLQLTLVSRDQQGSDLKAALQPLVDHFHARQQDIRSRLQDLRRGSPLGAGEELVVLQRQDRDRDICEIGKGVVKSFDDGYYQVMFAEQEAEEEEEAEDLKEKEILALLFDDLPPASTPHP